jgi:hypothetical protein
MTRWSPDTCGCVIDYDGNLNVIAVVTKCAKHADTLHDKHHFDTVLTHNRKKNHVHNALVEHMKEIGSNGSENMIAVAYDDNDDLHISGSGLSAEHQQKVPEQVNAKLGNSALKFGN